MCRAINRRSTGVKMNKWRISWLKHFNFSAEGIKKFDHHVLIYAHFFKKATKTEIFSTPRPRRSI